MEKEEQKLEQAEVEEHEEEETPLIVRKSRNENDSTITEIAAVGFEVSDAVDFEVRNGVYKSNGHAVQSEVAENGAENEELITPGNEQKIEELDGVLENESEAINGEQKSENLVFYDKVEGIWKCRICSWTYCNGSVCVDHFQNHKGQLHKLMNHKTLNFESEGVKSTSTYFGEKQILKDPGPKKFDISSLDFVVQNNSTSAINNRYKGEIEKNSIESSSLQPSQNSFQEGSTGYESSKEIESAEIDLINGDDLEVTELDVESVLQKQTTHDLYCPNCYSCITKRVILRKRKRRIRISGEEVKRNKTKTAVDSKLGTGSVQSPRDQAYRADEVGDNDVQMPTANEDERNRGPDIFRCLSCFSFFIPAGNGFKLFRIFGERSGKENVWDAQQPTVKTNWFTSMFASNKLETAVEQGSSFQTDVQKGDAVIPSSNLGDQSGQQSFSQKTRSPAHASEGLVGTTGNNDTQEGGDKILPFPNQKPSIIEKVAIGFGDKLDMKATETVDATMEQFDAYTTDQLRESKSNQEVHVNRESDLSVTTLSMRTQVTNGESAEVPMKTQVTNGEAAEVPMKTQVTNGEAVEDPISFSQQGGLKLKISSNKGSLTLENSDEGQIENLQPGGADKEVIQLSPTSASVLKTSDVDGKLNISFSVPHEEQDFTATILTESVLENKNANFRSSDSGQVYPKEVSQHIITKTKIEVHSSESLTLHNISAPTDAAAAQVKDTMITIDAPPAESTQTVQGIIHPTETASVSQSATQSSVADSERTEASKEFEIEVIKSIVYGGLAESITSLSVVSSAAGGGAATLNVLALGAANLIGGLFIICHNLWELRCDHIEQVSNQITEQRDRYKELLGRRQNFVLHAIVAIISYLIFGLVPPVVYGFSFRKSDDKQLKLVVVGAASLVCILVLAIGRAYIQRPPKPYLKTVITFVILGFMVSGVSYAAGELVERLLEKLGLFKASTVSNLVVPDMRPTGSGWTSY